MLDRALVQHDRVVVAALAVVLAGNVGVALGHPEPAGVGKLHQLVEDRPGRVEVALLQSLLEVHDEWNTARAGGAWARCRNFRAERVASGRRLTGLCDSGRVVNEAEAEGRTHTPDELAARATGPVRWLLDAAGNGGVPLTQTNAFARIVVRDAAERWPEWWNADLFGPPHRETDMALLEALREGLLRMRLVRRRGRKLLATVRVRNLASDPIALLSALALDLRGGEVFAAMAADRVVDELSENEARTHDQLVIRAHAAARWGWRDTTGNPPSERGVSWVVSDVLCRGEAHGLVERKPDPDKPNSWRALISLSPAGGLVLGRSRREVAGRTVSSSKASSSM